MKGTDLIAQERQRQIEVEGYTQTHDSFHNANEFVLAALSYLSCNFTGFAPDLTWPWDSAAFKPKDLKANLVRAGALIAAALDRIEENK